jgi:hypothetical protein
VTLSDLKATIAASAPPAGLSRPLVAMWHDAKGDWDAAHRVAQDVEDADGAWVHAYLHRKEGDDSNAAYWYRRAGRPVSHSTIEMEWEQIVTALLAADG